MENLEKKTKCLVITNAIAIIVAVAALGAAGLALARPTPSCACTTSTGNANGVSGSGGGSAAAVFSNEQLAVLNQTIHQTIHVTLNGSAGPAGRDGADGKNGTCLGVVGLNESIVIGGSTGWHWHWGADTNSWRYFYPLADVFAKVGDTLYFQKPWDVQKNDWGNEWNANNVHLFSDYRAFNECDFAANKSTLIFQEWQMQLSNRSAYKLFPQHANQMLLFASERTWQGKTFCERGVKVRVFVSPRLELPMVSAGGAAADSETVLRLRNTVSKLGRLAILTQLQLEQRIRSEGQSGLTDVRGINQGLKAYNDGHYSEGAIASIHNHADFLRTVGIGEIQAVLNGVEFQTRHNDYDLMMPANTTGYHDVVRVPFPDVPPVVLNQPDVQSQIREMQEWFRAFKEQNVSHRNYPQYFKPILCYLEGTWIKSTADLTDPFLSERHQIDAATWRELHDKIRFLANNGRKNLLENLAFLPNAVRDMLNDTWPVFANWEYRILCMPLKNDLPLERLRVAPDLSTQLHASAVTRGELYNSRKARFELNPYVNENDPLLNGNSPIPWDVGPRHWGYLDHLMEQIPGKDNRFGNLTDVLAGNRNPAYHYDTQKGVLNSAYYSRYYSINENDAMGAARHRRGFHDANLFAAQTSQGIVSEIQYADDINVDPNCQGWNCATDKVPYSSKWSYAIPMEIIYLTPLTKWNPHNIPMKAEADVRANGRWGGCGTPATEAYDGYAERVAFFTPAEFFGAVSGAGGGDTSGGNTCVLDSNGVSHQMRASGHWITFPQIGNGVGTVRQRFPIMPIHEMGSTTYKELKALQELTLASNYDTDLNGYFGHSRDLRGFTVEILGGGHQHYMWVGQWHVRQWQYPNGTYDTTGQIAVEVGSTTRNGHQHTVRMTRVLTAQGTWTYHIESCKYANEAANMYMPLRCHDGHTAIVRAT